LVLVAGNAGGSSAGGDGAGIALDDELRQFRLACLRCSQLNPTTIHPAAALALADRDGDTDHRNRPK
jgi:hypothetical protein